jgi:hypothetical protein
VSVPGACKITRLRLVSLSDVVYATGLKKVVARPSELGVCGEAWDIWLASVYFAGVDM